MADLRRESDGVPRAELRYVDGRNATVIQSIAPLLVFGSLIILNTVGGAYAALERDLPESFFLLGSFCVSMSVVVWFWNYSRRHDIAWVHDMGWFLLISWIVVVPYYLLKHEGKRGLRQIGLFCLAYLAAWLLGVGLVIAMRVVASV